MSAAPTPEKKEHISPASSEPSSTARHLFVHKTWHRTVIVTLIIVLGIPLIVLSATIGYLTHFENRAYPGVYLGERSVGGLSRGELKNLLHDYNNFLEQTGFTVLLTTASGTMPFKIPFIPMASSSIPAVSLDVEATTERILSIGRSDSWVTRISEPWRLLLRYRSTTTVFSFNEEEIIHTLKPTVAPFEREPRNAELVISSTIPLVYNVNPEHNGRLIQYQELLEALRARLGVLSRATLQARLSDVSADISLAEAEELGKKIPQIVGQGPLTLVYPQATKPKGGEYSWVITEEQIADWLDVAQNADGEPIAKLAELPLGQYINAIVRPDIDQPALDAKFSVENNRVKEFEPGQSGLTLDTTATIQNIEEALAGRSAGFTTTTAVPIVVAQVSSTRSLADLNTLGIVEIIGSGTSTFKDSHTNRIKNIANAVKRLNGVLIAPGEEFSTNKYAGPYITSNGFLPEMVIKGNQIIPEVGGGMCQIGTTVFRMAMNAGLPISQRQNHSLVVSYYADPVNHNPGTDATLYEPSLDLKFINDTNNYMLLSTDIDYKRQLLTFTVWGKSDGRSGGYTHPVVKRWIEPGPPQEIVSPTALPGTRKCQSAFRGAEATFTYTRFTSTSERIDRVFDSYYRPLPSICVVGASVVSTSPFNPPATVAAEVINPADPVIDTVAPPAN